SSAFGFSGQKCSACSRAVIHEDLYDQVLERAIELTKELSVGNPYEDTYMGPVINQKQFDKIKDYIAVGKEEGELKIGCKTNDSYGNIVHQTIFADVDPNERIIQEEIFIPVLAYSKAKDFDEMLEIANNTQYGLTGAVITNTRENWHKACRDFDVGNLYLNRG